MRRLVSILSVHRNVLANFIARDLKVKYRGTVFGYLWSLLEPLSSVLIYWFVFSVIARRGGPEYPLVVILGVLPFNYLSSVITMGAGALTGNALLIRRVYLPREVFVASTVGAQLVVFLMSLLVVIPFLFVYEVRPTAQLGLLPVPIVLITMFGSGVAFVMACANAVLRDVSYVLRVGMRLLFYGSPVIYPLDMVPERFRALYLTNPIAVYLAMGRSAVLGTELEVPAPQLASAVLIAFAAFFFGVHLFARWEKRAVKYL